MKITHCLNCEEKLTDYELKRQCPQTTKYFYCITCRSGWNKHNLVERCVICRAEIVGTDIFRRMYCDEHAEMSKRKKALARFHRRKYDFDLLNKLSKASNASQSAMKENIMRLESL